MKVIILHQTVTNHDAIGNDIEMMYRIFNKKWKCYIYAQNQFNRELNYISEEELDFELNQVDTIFIYHHSVFWKAGEEILNKAKGKIIIRYHNITPAEFFEGYNENHFSQCSLGRKQTVRLAKIFSDAVWLVDSNYNAEDIIAYVAKENIFVCPPFHKIEEWADKKPDENVLKELVNNQMINLLFVGRVVPNKGHILLIDILYSFCKNYDNKVKLRVIGKFDDGLAKYNDLIKEKINRYGLGNYIEFIGEINDATLMSYYLGSDIFICTSEHEGFCVPIVEANYFGLPIIARNSSAIPETMGKGEVILQEDEKAYAAAIHVIMGDIRARKMLIKNGQNNYNTRFQYNTIYDTFKKVMESTCGFIF